MADEGACESPPRVGVRRHEMNVTANQPGHDGSVRRFDNGRALPDSTNQQVTGPMSRTMDSRTSDDITVSVTLLEPR